MTDQGHFFQYSLNLKKLVFHMNSLVFISAYNLPLQSYFISYFSCFKKYILG